MFKFKSSLKALGVSVLLASTGVLAAPRQLPSPSPKSLPP